VATTAPTLIDTASELEQSFQLAGDDDRLAITVDEVARLLSLKRSTAYHLVNCGEIPSIRIGKRVRVPIAALHKMIAAGGSPQPVAPSAAALLAQSKRAWRG
jgi:excisionase family DNA binding protein